MLIESIGHTRMRDALQHRPLALPDQDASRFQDAISSPCADNAHSKDSRHTALKRQRCTQLVAALSQHADGQEPM